MLSPVIFQGDTAPPPLPASYQGALLFGVRKKTAEIFVLGRNVDCFFPSITIGLD